MSASAPVTGRENAGPGRRRRLTTRPPGTWTVTAPPRKGARAPIGQGVAMYIGIGTLVAVIIIVILVMILL